MGLVLGDLVGVVNLAVINPAGVDVEGKAQHRAGHHRAFEMPARRAAAPRRIPFHLAGLARRGLAPDREIGRMALAVDRLDPALPLIRGGAREASIIGHGRDVEVQPARQFVAMLRGDALRERDHLRDIVRRHRPLRRLADVERTDIGPVGLLVVLGDVPDRLRLRTRHPFHLVFAGIRIVGQVPNVGDVDHVGELITAERQRPPEHVGEDIGPHVADMRIVVDGRPAGIDPRLAFPHRMEGFGLTGQAVEQDKRGIAIGRHGAGAMRRFTATVNRLPAGRIRTRGT